MNRKLLVIAMVPLLVGFAGAMAFSSYQGSITKTITVQTGIVKVSEKVECVGAFIQGYVVLYPSYTINGGGLIPLKPIVLDGDHGLPYSGPLSVSSCPVVKECHVGDSCSGDPGTLSLIGDDPITFLSPTVSSATFNLDIQYMAPGDWIELDLVEQAATCPQCLEATLTSTLGPAPGSGLAGDVFNSPAWSLVPTLGPYSLPATSGGWTWLQDTQTNYCREQYIPSPNGIINVGPKVDSNFALEYCASGSLAPAAAPGALSPGSLPGGLTPGAGPVTVGSGIAYTYLLIGDDYSATNAMMGVCGALQYTVTAYSP